MGYSHCERRKKMIGTSNIAHEIDIFATQGYEVLAVECKNYGEGRKVGPEELRNFQGKIEDLPTVNHKLFVTNMDFTVNARTYAGHHKIDLRDGEKLMHLHYQMTMGRLKPLQLSSTGKNGSMPKKQLVLDLALPLSVDYKQVTSPLLVNPLSIEIYDSKLEWLPFYVFEYEINRKTGILGRKRYTEDQCLIVNATTGEKLLRYDEDEDDIKKPGGGLDTITNYLPKLRERYSQSFKKREFCFIPREYWKPEDFEVAKDTEVNKIIQDLTTIKSSPKTIVRNESSLDPYQVVLVEPQVPINAAQRMMLEEIIEDTKAKYDDVRLRNSSLIYVPKWIINFQTKNGKKSYRRKALAASNTVIIDEIKLCPKEVLARIRPSRKFTYAVCEQCGNVYCRSHIRKRNNSYHCKDCK